MLRALGSSQGCRAKGHWVRQQLKGQEDLRLKASYGASPGSAQVWAAELLLAAFSDSGALSGKQGH